MEKNVDILYSSDGKPLIKGGYKHSAEKKLELVSLFLQYGSLRKASMEVGISYNITRYWKDEPWWKKAIAELKKRKRSERDHKIDKIIDKSLDAVEERIDNGDYVYDQKTGEVVRKPVSLREVRGVANDLLQRQLMIEKAAVEEQHMLNDQKVKEQLKLLQEEFSKFNTKRTIDVVAKEPTDALHDQRETGLQEGVGLGTPTEAYTSEGTGSPECSPEDDEGLWGECDGEGCGPQDSSEQGWDELEE